MGLITKIFSRGAIPNYLQARKRFALEKEGKSEAWREEMEQWRLLVADEKCVSAGKCTSCKCTIPSTEEEAGLEKGDMCCDGQCFPFAPQNKLGWTGFKAENMVKELVMPEYMSSLFLDSKVDLEINDNIDHVVIVLKYKNTKIKVVEKDSIRALAFQIQRTNIISLKKIFIGYDIFGW